MFYFCKCYKANDLVCLWRVPQPHPLGLGEGRISFSEDWPLGPGLAFRATPEWKVCKMSIFCKCMNMLLESFLSPPQSLGVTLYHSSLGESKTTPLCFI